MSESKSLLIFLVGHHASGKTEAANYLVYRYEFLHIETSTIIKARYELDTSKKISISQWVANSECKYGKNFTNKLILDVILENINHRRVVVTGNREFSGWFFLKTQLTAYFDVNLLVAIISPLKILYIRYKARNRSVGDNTLSQTQFYDIYKEEQDKGLQALLSKANDKVYNLGKLEDLFIQLSRIIDYQINKNIHSNIMIRLTTKATNWYYSLAKLNIPR